MVWVGQAAVVALPAEVDVGNADQIREDLLSVINLGAATLIVDMTAMTFCDSSGVNAVVRAFRRAEASRTEMRLAICAPAVRRVFAVTGVDRLIDVYPSLAASLAGKPSSSGSPRTVASGLGEGETDSRPQHPLSQGGDG